MNPPDDDDGLAGLRRRLPLALAWGLAAGLAGAAVGAWLGARAPDEFQASCGLRLSLFARDRLATVEIPLDPSAVGALLLGPRVRAEVARQPALAAALGLRAGAGELAAVTAYARHVSVVTPRETTQLVWVLTRAARAEDAVLLAEQVARAGGEVLRQEAVRRCQDWRARLAREELELRAGLLELEGRRATPAGEGPQRRVEQLVLEARQRAQLEDLQALDRRRRALADLCQGTLEPWELEVAAGPTADLSPRDRLTPIAASAVVAAALGALAALARELRPRG